MYAIYILISDKIQVHFTNDILEAELLNQLPFHDSVIIYEMGNGEVLKETTANIYRQGNHLYFNYNNQSIGIRDFDAYSVNELVNKLKNNYLNISNYEILATFLKNSDDIILYSIKKVPSKIIKSIYGTNEKVFYKEVLCTLINKHFSKYEWPSNIEIVPILEEDRKIFGVMESTFEELCLSLRLGRIRIANKNNIKQKTLSKCVK